jgi:hypothetical protein
MKMVGYCSMENERLVIAPEIGPPMTLEQLLEHITDHNPHHEVETGPATGKEEW